MIKHYIYLKIYHYNIKKISSNEKLLCYLKSILVANGFDIKGRETRPQQNNTKVKCCQCETHGQQNKINFYLKIKKKLNND